jgi:hypothetical protein
MFSSIQTGEARFLLTSQLHTPFPIYVSPSQKFVFRDLFPQKFRSIRTMFGIKTEEYLSSLSKPTKERFSEGASGAFMYFSKDNVRCCFLSLCK